MKINIGTNTEFDADTVILDLKGMLGALKDTSQQWVGKALTLLSALRKASDIKGLDYDVIDITKLESLERLAFEINPQTNELYEELKPLRDWLDNLVSFKQSVPFKKAHETRVVQMYTLIVEALGSMISVS